MITLVANAGLSKQFEHCQDKELCKKKLLYVQNYDITWQLSFYRE